MLMVTPCRTSFSWTVGAAVTGIVFSDDFETNRGWQTNPNGSDTATTGRWEVSDPESTSTRGTTLQLGTTVSGARALVTEGRAGAGVGRYDIDSGITSIRSPGIALAAGETYDLSMSYYFAHL